MCKMVYAKLSIFFVVTTATTTAIQTITFDVATSSTKYKTHIIVVIVAVTVVVCIWNFS